ncbi:hypothetical protein ES703_39713 [subsurface metagenome]
MLYYGRIGMRPACRAEKVERIGNVSRPVAKCVVDSVFERPCPTFNGDDFCTTQSHLMNIDALALNISYAHKDFRLHTEQSANHCGSQAVLSCAGFGDEFSFAHILC